MVKFVSLFTVLNYSDIDNDEQEEESGRFPSSQNRIQTTSKYK